MSKTNYLQTVIFDLQRTSRSIIESHGGTIRVSGNKPYGTIFHVILPSGDL
jgi:signal transduction histidine kinase